MKPIKLMLGMLFFPSLVGFTIQGASSAFAQCVQTDVSIQYNISGSKEPTKRTNDVVFENSGSCSGNASTTVGVQGNVGGTGKVEQRRQVRHTVKGDNNNKNNGGPNVQTIINVPIDVYNPADRLKK
jgi:hypothetical protein